MCSFVLYIFIVRGNFININIKLIFNVHVVCSSLKTFFLYAEEKRWKHAIGWSYKIILLSVYLQTYLFSFCHGNWKLPNFFQKLQGDYTHNCSKSASSKRSSPAVVWTVGTLLRTTHFTDVQNVQRCRID